MKSQILAEMSRRQMLDFLEGKEDSRDFSGASDEEIRDHIIDTYEPGCIEIHTEAVGIAFPGIFSENLPGELEE